MANHGSNTGHRPLKVLVVEDELLIADYLGQVIEDAGHEVAGIAPTVAAALRILDGETVDLVSLDVKLPGGADGVDLAGMLRARGGPPFLFVTGSGDPAFRARCEATGPLAILQKPVSPSALTAVLASAARGAERQEESGPSGSPPRDACG
ncbi:response regulator [Muricoccus aerilatus]|uniref:response regulator n=1 Tax=Muricoccus aerilatus TaxID=452982 RepID=UPI000693A0AE|nr:response regulator [Roseomonas aerilata]